MKATQKKIMISAVTGLVATGLAVVGVEASTITPAQAATGKMTHDEWKFIEHADTNLWVDTVGCDCSGDQVPDGDGRAWTRTKEYTGGVCGCQWAEVGYGDKDGDGVWRARWKEYRLTDRTLVDSVYWDPKF